MSKTCVVYDCSTPVAATGQHCDACDWKFIKNAPPLNAKSLYPNAKKLMHRIMANRNMGKHGAE